MNNSNVSISGDRNFVEVSQSGTNLADLMIGGRREGDNNTVNIVQTAGTVAGQNVITATIYGDDNNTNLGFTGGTLTVSSSLGLNPGDMFQSGSGNTITLTVGDRLGESSGNAFEFSQNGVGNEIIGSISQGGANQVAVVQAGTANSTNFNQIGSFNSLGVTQ